MNILLTGGAGYIGSHTALELLKAGHDVIVVDNFANSSPEALIRVEKLAARSLTQYAVDLLDRPSLEDVFRQHAVDAVIHFAGLKAVGESVSHPLEYYHTNLLSSINLVEVMEQFDVRNLVFSSSATVYGEPEEMPITEAAKVSDAANPYGRTKLMIEKILEDLQRSSRHWNIIRLRYFNPAGADSSGEIGEDPNGIPNNLLPFVTQFAVGKHPKLVVNGDDYPTQDGTCIRDYIHVTDLALGHLAALGRLQQAPGLATYNLGSGRGQSVLEVINAFEQATGLKLNYEIGSRRAGDIPESYTDPTLAERELKWQTTRSMRDICTDAWRWQQQNPNGYPEN